MNNQLVLIPYLQYNKLWTVTAHIFYRQILFCKYTLKERDENYQSISSWLESPADVYEVEKILQQFQQH
jgi:hypothetical protein